MRIFKWSFFSIMLALLTIIFAVIEMYAGFFISITLMTIASLVVLLSPDPNKKKKKVDEKQEQEDFDCE